MTDRWAEYAKAMGMPLVSNLILGADLVKCSWSGCGALTRWRTPRQPKHGTCRDHAVWPPQPFAMASAVAGLMETFPGATVSAWTPRRWHQGEYEQQVRRVWVRSYWRVSRVRVVRSFVAPPEDMGPCLRCGTGVCASGPNAYPFCFECDEERKR